MPFTPSVQQPCSAKLNTALIGVSGLLDRVRLIGYSSSLTCPCALEGVTVSANERQADQKHVAQSALNEERG